MGNTAQQCKLGLFQDSDFAGDPEDSKSTSAGPISWMCKKRTSVSNSSTEAEIISLDAGLHSSHDTTSNRHTQNQTKDPTKHNNLELSNVDYGSSNAKSSLFGAMLYIFEDNEAVIKRIIKGRSPTMRHVSRTHRVALD